MSHHSPWDLLDERELRERQARKLRTYLGDVVLPFSARYRALFAEAGLSADSIRSLDDLRRIPFTSKKDLMPSPDHPQRAREFIIVPDPAVLKRRPSTLLKALFKGKQAVQDGFEREFRPIFLTSTTGRSADPVPFVYSQHDLNLLGDTGRRLFEVCGARRDLKLLNLFPYAPHLAFWQTHYGGAAFGVFVLSTGGGKFMGTDGNLRMIQKIKPDVLIGMPTFIYHVLQHAVETGMRIEGLQRVVLGGERVAEGLRRKLARMAHDLGSPNLDVVATYGFTEAKMAWGQCPCPVDETPSGYHLYPDLGIMEVVDPVTGDPLPPGSPGELVFTPLDSRGSVVLRYRTGDVIDGGLVHEPCPRCGRRVPRLVGNIRRKSDVRELQLDKIKGTLVDFNQLEHVLDDSEALGAWQLELRKRNDDPCEVDEVVLHVHPIGITDTQTLSRNLQNEFSAKTELHLNRIVFHDADEMRTLQGVGVQLKEQKVVDHRPKDVPSPAGKS
ncbi:MAG: phenylacetate--CoA ligase [Verrucomicrobia bacterium]|nr:phenylacetate--CoA ligase [Verrucomicrobiota bacterium]